MRNQPLIRAVLILLLFFAVIAGVVLAGSFLKPLALALLIALLLVPVARKLEKSGVGRFAACILADLIFVLVVAGILFLLSYQVKQVAGDWDQIQKEGKEQFEKVQTFIVKQVGVSEKEQEQAIEKAVNNFASGSQSKFTSMLKNTLGSVGDLLLIAIYILLLLYYRHKFANFVYKAFSGTQKSKLRKILEGSKNTAVNYLGGRLILIVLLAIFYSIGFLAFGVKYAIFYAVFASILTLIPYLGNVIGVMLPLATTLLSDDPGQAFFGVLIVFAIIQFLESYILQPLVVGKKVNINPFFTIFIVVLGGAIWGVIGMMVAIPYLGILYVIMNNTEKLKPYAYLIGEEEDSDSDSGIEKAMGKLKDKITG
ncbi:MAG: AI-2E family transporter [Cyclobacteriaceae bacterium]